ncbi:ABC transporter substrate-binding protein [Paenibacillus eucommiae]|uniref:Raffinose/stachyose/melibiose transport system substrate-binding protein n=1 Tax=Paenibacillus eucommiae TaxID=1355755 RepID=A0ABS4J3U9_9BACL|nr:extracellular solute-binding protein [Paenibacillus eucommiae]MBP1994519.1 raffinose/stachyose/melibiose transport system substrate-binding protein [Paenibacillus eucommiae]
MRFQRLQKLQRFQSFQSFNRSNRFKTIAVSMLLFVMIVVSACSNNGDGGSKASGNGGQEKGGSKEPVTITYMISQTSLKEVHKKMAEKIKQDENITVEFEVVPDVQYTNLLQTKIASGEVPDVVALNMPEHLQIFNIDNFEDLSSEPWVTRLNNPDQFKYMDGKFYGFPYAAPELALGAVYNKKVFADLSLSEPKTYSEFISALDTIKASGIDPIYMSNKELWTTQIAMLIYTNAALKDRAAATYTDLIENKKKFADVPEYKQAMEAVKQLVTGGYVNKNHVTATYDMAKEMVATEKAALMINGQFAINDIAAKWPNADIGFFPIPYEGADSVVTSNIFNSLAIMKNGKQVDKVKKWLDLWSQPEYQNLFNQENPGIPGVKDATPGEIHPAIQSINDNYLNKGKSSIQMNDYFNAMGNFGSGLLYPIYVEILMDRNIDEAIKDIDKGWQDLGKEKKLPGF